MKQLKPELIAEWQRQAQQGNETMQRTLENYGIDWDVEDVPTISEQAMRLISPRQSNPAKTKGRSGWQQLDGLFLGSKSKATLRPIYEGKRRTY